MGCCGCSNKSSAVTAGIFGLIQSIIGLICNVYFISLYSDFPSNWDVNSLDQKTFLLYATRNAKDVIMILLVVATILHTVWFISSIVLLVGNANNNSRCVRQWVVSTSLIIIGDIVLPAVLKVATLDEYKDVVNSVTARDQISGDVSSEIIDLYMYYIILLISFVKLGLFTIITNICLNVYTRQRANEISKPRGYVMSVMIIQGQSAVPNTNAVGPGTAMTQPSAVCNNTASGMRNPYYGNIPMQSAVALASSTIPDSGSEDICNSMSELLLPPKYTEKC